ncbi:MAG TPA: DegV family protein, partial [Flexilinea sp.]|nr:DegV family protein [Flexilinea sp.]
MMMQIVTDSGCDLSDEQKRGLPIHVVPLGLVLNGVSYDKNHPITPAEFYQKMVETDVYPSTSQASAGDFADVYRELSANGEEILSIHISSGLSGTLNS